jgi:alpha-galactosidase
MAHYGPRWILASLMVAACDATPTPPTDAAVDAPTSSSDAAVDAPTPDAPAVDAPPVEVAPDGFRVILGDDGRLRIETSGVAVRGVDLVLRLGDGSERALSSMTLTAGSAPGSVVGRSADGWSVTLGVAAAGEAARVAWEVCGAGTLRGVDLRSPAVSLPADARVMLDGSQSWSFTGALAIAPGTVRARDAMGGVAWPTAAGDVVQDAATTGFFRGDVAWSGGGLSLCADAPFDRWTAVLAERPTTQWRLQVATGLHPDEAVAITAAGPPARGAWVLARAQSARPFACSDAALAAPRTRPASPFPRGWWSWNTLFEGVTRARVEAQVDAMRALDARARHVTIDDGWERAWGDWQEREAFGGTLADTADALRARGVSLGLWLAPFAVDPAAPLAAQHPEWMVREPSGAPLEPELVPGRRFRVLDMTVPAAREHLRAVFAGLRARGVTLFKIDFLFAAALPGVRADASLTGLQAYRLGLAAIAEGAGDAHINGCGAVILPALPYVDSMRVGADLTFATTPPFWAAVSAAARNLAARRGSLRWGVLADPDQPVLRGYTPDEGRANLAVGALSGGAFGYGDDLSALTDAQSAVLREAWFTRLRDELTEPATPLDGDTSVAARFTLSPLLDGALNRFRETSARPPSVWRAALAGGETWAVLFNWREEPAALTVPPGVLGARAEELVAAAAVAATADGASTVMVPAHAVRVLRTLR